MDQPLDLPTGTVTFLLTDVEGSTALFERSPHEAQAALQRHHVVLSEAVRRHGGLQPVEQGEGDSIVAVFSRAPDAVACAADAQRRLRVEPWREGIDVRVRMSVHTGEAVLREAGRYTGLAIHRAARVRGLAHGGQVLITAATADLTADELPDAVELFDLGSHRLRDLSRSERIYQLRFADDPEVFPPLRSLDAITNNLPSQLTSFVGRQRELGEIAELLGRHRLVTLAGAGGAGKTRLAIQVAADTRGDIEAVWLVELATMPAESDLSSFVNAATGGREQPGRDAFETLVERLDSTRSMVVIDNCEHVIDASARFVADLSTAVPSLVVLATSREPLGVPGETVYRVPSMELPDGSAPADETLDTDAVQLFVERAQLVRPTFRPSADDLVAIIEICTRLDGLPLAIELAAARTRVMAPETIASGLADRFRLLTGGGRTAMARQQTLRASIDWSYGLLSPAEQTVLQRLAVFAGGFALDGVEPVVAGDGIDRYEILDLLSQLIDKSLVQAEPIADAVRYRLLESVRDYALERLADSADFESTRDRHLAHVVSICEDARSGLEGSRLPVWVAQLGMERANLNSAFEWAGHRGRGDDRWSMCGALTFFWMSAGHFTEAQRWFAQCALVPATDPADELAAKCGAAHVAFYAGRYEDGVALASEALAAARRSGDDRYAARAMSSLATIDIYSDPAAAALALREAAELAGSCGDDWCRCDATQIAGYCFVMLDRHDEAIEALDVALPLARRLDNAQLLAWDLLGRGWVHSRRGEFAEAQRALIAGMRQAERTGDPNISGMAISLRTPVEVAAGRAESWLPVVEEALARSIQVGAGTAVPGLALALLFISVAIDDIERAEALVADYGELVCGFLPALGSRFMTAAACAALARADLVAAKERSTVALELATEIGNPVETAVARTAAAVAELLAHRPDRADEHLHAAMPVLARSGCVVDLLDCLGVLAASAAVRQQPEESLRLWGAVWGSVDRLGIADLPSSSVLAAVRATAEQELDATEVERLLAEGAARSLEETVSYVSRSRGDRKRPATGWDSLTPTENEVVALMAQGLSNARIGEQMFISAGTVKTHLGHVYAKLGLANRTQVTAALASREH